MHVQFQTTKTEKDQSGPVRSRPDRALLPPIPRAKLAYLFQMVFLSISVSPESTTPDYKSVISRNNRNAKSALTVTTSENQVFETFFCASSLPPPIVLHGYFGGTYLHGSCDTGRRRSGHGQISNRSGNERVLHSSGRYGSGTGQRRRTRPASYTVPRLSLLSTTPLCAARLAVTRHTISTAKTLTFRFALHILTRGAYYIDFEDKNIPSSIFRRDETHVITRREYDKKKILTFLKLCVL